MRYAKYVKQTNKWTTKQNDFALEIHLPLHIILNWYFLRGRLLNPRDNCILSRIIPIFYTNQ